MYNWKWFALYISLLSLLCLKCTKAECLDNENCNFQPDAGPCLGKVDKFYYDNIEKKCKTFKWGGCEGVVPFQTLEECQQSCSCN